MNKKTIKIIIILAVLVLVGLAALFVINNYRGEDGLTYSERKQLEKNGEAVVDWDAMEEAQEEEGFFARLFNGKDDKRDKENTSATTDTDSKNDNTSSKNDSDNDAKKPASEKDENSNTDKEDNSKGDRDSGKGDDSGSGSDDDSDNDSDQESDSDKDSGSELTGDARAYADYIAMSPEKQEAYFETFDSPEAFIKWFNKAKAAYEAANDSVEVEGGGIDIGDYQ